MRELARVSRAVGIPVADDLKEFDLAVFLRQADSRSEVLLPFLVRSGADLALLAEAATPNSPHSVKARRALHALLYLVEWGPQDPVYGSLVAHLVEKMAAGCGGRQRIREAAVRAGVDVRGWCPLLPYPSRYLKLAATLARPVTSRQPAP